MFKIKDETDPKLHPLYVKIENKNSQLIYFHKYFGVFTTEMPLKQHSLAGGILADEMGLGKTLEILATIIINPRTGQLKGLNSIIEESEKKMNKNKVASKKEVFSCICGNKPEAFKTDIEKETINDPDDEDEEEEEEIEFGKRSKKSKSKKPKKKIIIRREPIVSTGNQRQPLEVYQCVLCKLWMHAKCVNYNGTREMFICLPCHEKIPPIPSACTLIVTPSIISKQWSDEIQKHSNKKLKVLFYNGFSKARFPSYGYSYHSYNQAQDFVQPRDLANLDICITTYDVLADELAHVFAIENTKVLRQPKRFMTLPSPLLYVEWWRICLDEAQMVHSTNTKCADMANRLRAVNRWCITGTPIGRSLTDLHGLFTFIRQDPFCEKRWFDEILFHPFNSGDRMPLAIEASKVLWRTTKKLVENQVDLPQLTEKVYRLNFSPFELHLYDRVREDFRKNNKNLLEPPAAATDVNGNGAAQTFYASKLTKQKNVNDYNPQLRLDELDRQMIDQILAPIIDLRVTCKFKFWIILNFHLYLF
jgi:E3 ubiquitin-protein ligase SHPRH